jgi:hypothetical protein
MYTLAVVGLKTQREKLLPSSKNNQLREICKSMQIKAISQISIPCCHV